MEQFLVRMFHSGCTQVTSAFVNSNDSCYSTQRPDVVSLKSVEEQRDKNEFGNAALAFTRL